MPVTPTIAVIEPSPKSPRRAVVRVGRRIVATLPVSQVERLGLALGVAWDEALAARVREAVALDRLTQRAMKKIDRRALSRAELRARLIIDHVREETAEESVAPSRQGGASSQRGTEAPPCRDGATEPADRDRSARIDAVLDHLTRIGALDDAALGQALIEETLHKAAAGPALLRDKLMRRGIEETLAERLIDEAERQARASADESSSDSAGGSSPGVAGARALAAKKLATMAGVDAMTRRRRIAGLLVRRGFDEDVVGQVLEELCPE